MPVTSPSVVQGTAPVPLRPRSTRGLKPKQAQHPFHRYQTANAVEVDTGHDCSSFFSQGRLALGEAVPFPFISL